MNIWIQALLNPKASSLNLQKERLQQAGNIEAFTFTFTLIGMILFRALSRFRALFDGDGPSAQNRDTTVLIIGKTCHNRVSQYVALVRVR